jgi:hypothetical protein
MKHSYEMLIESGSEILMVRYILERPVDCKDNSKVYIKNGINVDWIHLA